MYKKTTGYIVPPKKPVRLRRGGGALFPSFAVCAANGFVDLCGLSTCNANGNAYIGSASGDKGGPGFCFDGTGDYLELLYSPTIDPKLARDGSSKTDGDHTLLFVARPHELTNQVHHLYQRSSEGGGNRTVRCAVSYGTRLVQYLTGATNGNWSDDSEEYGTGTGMSTGNNPSIGVYIWRGNANDKRVWINWNDDIGEPGGERIWASGNNFSFPEALKSTASDVWIGNAYDGHIYYAAYWPFFMSEGEVFKRLFNPYFDVAYETTPEFFFKAPAAGAGWANKINTITTYTDINTVPAASGITKVNTVVA